MHGCAVTSGAGRHLSACAVQRSEMRLSSTSLYIVVLCTFGNHRRRDLHVHDFSFSSEEDLMLPIPVRHLYSKGMSLKADVVTMSK
jgi:hypothetical protein